MNQGPLLFLGIFITMAASWLSFVLKPHLQVGRQMPAASDNGVYPAGRPGEANQGREVYRENGCVYCHTQSVRPSDVPQWGKRISVAQDYLADYPVMVGSQRIGPDLANIGARVRPEAWHLLHLYNPRSVVPESTMSRYPYLFTKRKIQGAPSANALKLPAGFEAETGYEVVPTEKARQLVAYLMSLQSDVSLFEAPLPSPPTNAVNQAQPTPAAK
jgi:cytochrome c oxidase cbb3-type subunit 2